MLHNISAVLSKLSLLFERKLILFVKDLNNDFQCFPCLNIYKQTIRQYLNTECFVHAFDEIKTALEGLFQDFRQQNHLGYFTFNHSKQT